MNILDEDIRYSQYQRLQARKIHVRQIGIDVGRSGMQDRDDIIPLLHGLKNPTFFSCDHGFYHPTLRHQGYCLVYTKLPSIFVASCVTDPFAHKPREWANSFAFAIAA